MMGLVAQGVRSLLFPLSCVGCSCPLETSEQEPLCPGCLRRLPVWQMPGCRRCGSSLAHQGAGVDLCLHCRLHRPTFDQAISPFLYEGVAKELITALKYRGRFSLGRFLADAMSQSVSERLPPVEEETLLPVPLHTTRLRERSFNQAVILAAGLQRRLGMLCRSDLLVRIRATRPQTELARPERQDNLQGAFHCLSRGVSGKNFLLVDDVLTTGSTAQACAAALKKAGAAQVRVVTAARG